MLPIDASSRPAIKPACPVRRRKNGRLGLGPFRPLSGRGPAVTPSLFRRTCTPKVPHLRTLGRTARNNGTLPSLFVCKVPNLRTRGRAVRRFGTILARLCRIVPFLRPHGQTVRKNGTLGRPGATRLRKPAAEKCDQTSDVLPTEARSGACPPTMASARGPFRGDRARRASCDRRSRESQSREAFPAKLNLASVPRPAFPRKSI